MEAFTGRLHAKIVRSNFVYHPKCANIGLTHLIFADDLFILCVAEMGSFCATKEALADFYSFSVQSGVYYTLLSAAIYPNWGARNLCIFQNIRQSKEVICCRIVQGVKSSLASWRNIPKSALNLRTAGDWECGSNIFKT